MAFNPQVLAMAERNAPAQSLAAVTKSDSTVYEPPLRGLYVGTGGDVAVMARGDTAAVTLTNVPSGSILPIEIKKVMSTNTTGSGFVALY